MEAKKLDTRVLVHLALYLPLLSATTSGAKMAGKLRIIQSELASRYFGCSSNHFCLALQVICGAFYVEYVTIQTQWT